MVDERGPATESSPPSFYQPEEVLSEMQAALCIPEEVCAAIRRGVPVGRITAALQDDAPPSPSSFAESSGMPESFVEGFDTRTCLMHMLHF